MAQYINKAALVAEIERKINEINLDNIEDWRCRIQREHDIEVMKNILSLIDTLEVKEEILDKKSKTNLMRKCVHKAYKRGYDMGVLQTTNKMKHNAKEADLDKELFDWYNKEKNTDYNASILYEKYNNTLKKLVKHFFKN